MKNKTLPPLKNICIILIAIASALFASFVPDWRHQFAAAGYYNYASLTWLMLLLNSDTNEQLPLSENFDRLSITSPDTTIPFKSENKLYHPMGKKISDFQNIQVSTNANSLPYSINLIPDGNPSTDENGILSSAILKDKIDVSSYSAVILSFWANSTSNPRLESVNNCDSSLDILYRLDEGNWQDFSSICGQHKTETSGWQHFDFSNIPIVTGEAKTIEFAFEYYIQNSNGDTSAYYLIDDLKISGIQ